MGKIRYGMIGFGGIAENRLAKEGFACDRKRFAPLEEAELVAVTDVNPARKAAAEALGLGWRPDADAMRADPGIDAVVVATNNRTHFPLASQALRASKPVLVEKPISTTSKEAAELVALAAEKGLSLGVDHMMVYNVLNRKAHELIANGAIGPVNDATFHMQVPYGYEPAEAASWRCSRIEEMGGPIGDVASHCFYLMEFLLGVRITAVRAVYYPKKMAIAAEDGALIQCDLLNGISATALVSFSDKRGGLHAMLGNLGYECYGDRGALRGYGTMFQLSGYRDEPYPIRLELDKPEGLETFTPDKPVNLYQESIRSHANSIRSGHRLTGEDGLRNVKLCEAAHLSARRGGETITLQTL